MLVAVICKDKPNALPLRMETRAAHLDYVARTGVVTLAGPFLNAAGEMSGSLIVLDVADLAAAKDWAAGDPYAVAGLFASVEITEWKRAIG
ncbi:YciI family protein [Falsirhodobacter halotolerans]|uniref:YciI family protein n=1 Tax=Falsirhodobacter halotolerans TaxID=1146892 RepID=UPI001FD37EBE|nr:YciI family protein [Falsirhodobacter halotolerans]MCJ8140790.1 YciI family protein [Falsirhodobacter halotolerans]